MTPSRCKIVRRHRRRHQGMALVLVVSVMAVAAIMGYAMLSSSALQAASSSNAASAAVADAQAESGINLALYYLQNPSNAPSLTNGVWPGAANITFAPVNGNGQSLTAIAGSVTVTVTKVSTNVYDVTSVGSSQGAASGGGVITRTLRARIAVTTAYLIKQAVGLNSTVTVASGATFTGSPTAIRSNQAVTIQSGGKVVGNVYALSVTNSGQYTGQTYPAPAVSASPTSADVHDYRSYAYQGQTYAAQLIGSGSLNNVSYVPDPVNNPLGVFWYSGDLIINSNVSITGTLIVKSGKLSVRGTSNTIVAQTNMPALLVDNTLEMKNGKSLAVTGVAWAGQGVVGTGVGGGSSLTINGALLIDTGGITGFKGTLGVTYNSNLANIPDLSSANQTPQSAKISTWTP